MLVIGIKFDKELFRFSSFAYLTFAVGFQYHVFKIYAEHGKKVLSNRVIFLIAILTLPFHFYVMGSLLAIRLMEIAYNE